MATIGRKNMGLRGNDQTIQAGSRNTTLLDLVFSLRSSCDEEDALVAAARDQVRTGASVLCGNFAGEINRFGF